MTRNQLHGKKFEDIIKGCGLFPGSSDSARGPTASFDVEPKFDRKYNLPTSIKTTGGDGIGLSDARRFWAIAESFRMLVGCYTQNEKTKTFVSVHEFIITPEIMTFIRGDVTHQMVWEYHNGLLLNNFPEGEHGAARQWAQQQSIKLSAFKSDITLNPKIDSKSQRRLQCSVSARTLIDRCSPSQKHFEHAAHIGDVVLPFSLISGEREFN